MKRKSGAIGFAVYLDSFENTVTYEYDVDVLLVYSKNADLSMLKNKADEIIAKGESVLMQTEKPDGIKYKRFLIEKDGEVICIEDNA